jgi:hypothetical protein
MATQLKLRRGTAAQNNSFTGAAGEITIDNDTKNIRIHDGSSAGGRIIRPIDITNCTTEIPENVKYELSGTTLKIKSGSKIYYPNGVNGSTKLFGVATLTQDETTMNFDTNNGTVYLVRRNASGTSGYYGISLGNMISGTDASSLNGKAFYNRTTNKISWVNTGVEEERLYSFPILKLTITNGTVTSVDQIYNGLSFFGSCVVALPGLKYLVPRGFKTDNTPNNAAWGITSCQVSDVPSNTGTNIGIRLANNSLNGFSNLIYDPITNYNYLSSISTSNKREAAICGYVSYTSGKVTSFYIKPVFQAVDQLDFTNLQYTVNNGINNSVHLTGDQNIGGTKTFYQHVQVKHSGRNSENTSASMFQAINPEVDLTQSITTGYNNYAGLYCGDSGGREIGYCRTNTYRNTANTANINQLELIAVDPDTNHTHTAGNRINTSLYLKADGTNREASLNFSPGTSSNGNQIATTKFVKDVLAAIYPVGSIYIGTQSTCPLASFFGTWTKIEGRYLLASGTLNGTETTYTATQTVPAGLPNITGTLSGTRASGSSISGAFLQDRLGNDYASGSDAVRVNQQSFDASRSSSIYGNSNTVQAPAYVVNVWRRTA